MNTTLFIPAIVAVVLIGFLYAVEHRPSKRTPKEVDPRTAYHYQKSLRIMSEHELRFYHLLLDAVGGKYYVFAQVHLSALFTPVRRTDRKVSYMGAFRHINGVSVDYVLCHPTTLQPLVAIELDDTSHDSPARRARDAEVERIFSEAELPLLRLRGQEAHDVRRVADRLKDLIPPLS